MKSHFWDLLAPRERKVILWVIELVLLYAVIGFLILPPIVRAVAVKQISQQLNREVSIEKVKINPFVLSVTV
jgi:type II secretory pathway component PulM